MTKAWKTLFKETLRKNGILALVAFVLLLLTATLPAASYLSMNDELLLQENLERLMYTDTAFIRLLFVLTMIAGLINFTYIHKTASVTAVHMLPFDRKEIFGAKASAGFLAILLPTLLNGIIVAAVIGLCDVDIPAAKVLCWIISLVATEAFVYAVTLIAGMLCGTVFMHMVGAIGLNILFPGIIVLVNFYCYAMLKGYVLADIWQTILRWTCPIISSENETGMPIYRSIYFIVLAAVFMALALVLYKKRNLEKATDHIVFKGVGPCVVFLLTFAAMTVIENYMRAFGIKYIGLVAGFILAYILSTMLVNKSTRIFNRSTFRKMGASALIIAIIVGMIGLDVFHYNQVPVKTGSLKYAATSTINDRLAVAQINYKALDTNRYASHLFMEDGDNMTRFSDPENMETLAALAKAVADNTEAGESDYMFTNMFYGMYSDFDFAYSDTHKARRWFGKNLTSDMDQYVKKLYESEEFKTVYALSNLNELDKYKATFMRDASSSEAIAQEDVKSLVAAMDKDFAQRAFEDDAITSKNYAGEIEFEYGGKFNPASYTGEKDLAISVRLSDKNTVKWLEDHGMMDVKAYADRAIRSVDLYYDDYDMESDEGNYYNAKLPKAAYEGLTAREFMDKYDGLMNSYDMTGFYSVTVNLVPTEELDYADSFTIYFSKDDVPAAIKNADYQVQ